MVTAVPIGSATATATANATSTNDRMNTTHMYVNPHANANHHQSAITVAGYRLKQKLGSGSFASVYKAIKVKYSSPDSETETETDADSINYNNSLPEIVAIKRIDRSSNKITKKVLENLYLEISILETYRHPNIVCLHQAHKSNEHFDLILEYCAGGDLQGLIRTRKSGGLSEPLTRRLMRGLTAGLAFLASQNLIHRDIKPQNLLLTGPLPLDELEDPARTEEEEQARRVENFPSSMFHLKLADFGFARHLQKASLADTLCGTPLYMAPEILQDRRYDNKADLWSTGTVLFEMIAGKPPFNGENFLDLLKNIKQKDVRLPPGVKVSQECGKLMRILLNRDPRHRASFQDFVKASDAFVSLGCNGEAVNVSDLYPVTSGIGASLPPILGPISEVEGSYRASSTAQEGGGGIDSRMQMQMQSQGQGQGRGSQVYSSLQTSNLHPHAQYQVYLHEQHTHDANNNKHSQSRPNFHFAPLEPSPPGPKLVTAPEGIDTKEK